MARLRRGRPDDSPALMPLSEHLGELRGRLFKSVLAIAAGAVVGWLAYGWLFEWISAPFVQVVHEAQAQGRNVQLALTGVTDPFVLQLQVSAVAGIVVAAPIWLYQVWRFVTPGLHQHERKWSVIVVASATPLFLAGALLAYVFMPNALDFLLGFTPQSVSNIVDVERYVSFFLNTVLVFGLGFLIPLFALLLNLAGVLPARTLIKAWRWILLGTFLFAAVATPDGNPFTMTLLALPIMVLLVVVMAIAWVHDRRRAQAPDQQWDDEELSPLPQRVPED